MKHREIHREAAIKSRLITAVVVVLGLFAPALSVNAHHGWSWTTGGNIELTGIIQTVSLGLPHGIVTVKAEDEICTVEVWQPWTSDRLHGALGRL
ncbi:MAG: hypothetical protein AAF220_03635 [Pseudomonadota bacterium]